MISLLQILILGLVQGAAEMLPVSSSAHVIAVEKLLGISPASPQAYFILAMLHTGSMFGALLYFWKAWKETYFSSWSKFYTMAWRACVATGLTGVVGYGLIKVIEKVYLKETGTGDIEELSNNLFLISLALLVSGIWIIVAGVRRSDRSDGGGVPVSMRCAAWMGFSQGLLLPFRGLSRSGTTISTGLLMGANRRRAEEFSFALGVILTPALIVRELMRVHKADPHALHSGLITHLVLPSLFGMLVTFVVSLVALRLLSRALEEGRWRYFGYYCMAASVGMFALGALGY